MYKTIITNIGKAAITEALSNETDIKLVKMAVGSGEIEPTADMTALSEEKYRSNLNLLAKDTNNPNQIIAELIIPLETEAFVIREAGVFLQKDIEGSEEKEYELFAIANLPITEKPKITDGSAKQLTIRLVLAVENSTPVVLIIDPNAATATRDYVNGKIEEHDEDKEAHQDIRTKIGTDIGNHNTDPNAHKNLILHYNSLPVGFPLDIVSKTMAEKLLRPRRNGENYVDNEGNVRKKTDDTIVDYGGDIFSVLGELIDENGAIIEDEYDDKRIIYEGKFLIENGFVYEISSFPKLFNEFGFDFTPEDEQGMGTVFRVFDARGRYVRYQDRGAGVDPDAHLRREPYKRLIPGAKATTNMQFFFSAKAGAAFVIPKGTKITSISTNFEFVTTQDLPVSKNAKESDVVEAECIVETAAANGLSIGDISGFGLMPIPSAMISIETAKNVTASSGGIDSGNKIIGGELGSVIDDQNKSHQHELIREDTQETLIRGGGAVSAMDRAIIPLNILLYEFVYYQVISTEFQKKIKLNSSSTTLPIINKSRFEELPFIVCSIFEQRIIVREIETRLSICDSLEANIKEALKKAETLRQSILKKAFEGKLLNEKELSEAKNSSDWEPAEKLLKKLN